MVALKLLRSKTVNGDAHLRATSELSASGRVLHMSETDSRARIEKQTRAALGVSVDEFIKRYEAGVYRSVPDEKTARIVNRLAMMLPVHEPAKV